LPQVEGRHRTTDSQVCFSKPPKPSIEIRGVEPGVPLTKFLIRSLRKWREIVADQRAVFQEERRCRAADSAYFLKFADDFANQNAESHETIDLLLKTLIKCTVSEEETLKMTEEARKEELRSGCHREQRLMKRAVNIRETGSRWRDRARRIAQKSSAQSTSKVREMLREVEEGN
jgi:hypothetical protein